MTTYYKILPVITVSATPPGADDPVLMSAADYDRATLAVSTLASDMLTASGGMGGFHIPDILIWTANVESSDYDTYLEYPYISPTKLRTTINPDPSFDFLAIYTAADQNPASAIINGGAFNNAGYWANCSIDRCLHIGLHEFGHLVETHLKFTHDYFNFPVCTVADDTNTNSVHCAADYGFGGSPASDPDGSLTPAWPQISPEWYAAFFTGTVGDGGGPLLDDRGVGAAGWALPTKHSDGLRPALSRPLLTNSRPILVQNAAGGFVPFRYRQD